jgi:Tol biopolymer transport system component
MHIRATFAALFFVVATAASAHADSIVYIRGADATLWVARPDGTHARKLSNEPMAWPSESNTGVVVARGPGRRAPDGTAGSDIYVFAPSGRLEHRIPTPADYSTLDCPTFAPSHIHISPDGSKVAYDTWMCDHFTTFWTPISSHSLNWPNQKLGQEGGLAPAWLGNGQLLVTLGTRVSGGEAFARYQPGDGDNSASGWFSDGGWADEWYAFASSDGKKIAVVEDDAPDRLGTPSRVAIKLYSVSGADPHADCAANIPFGPGFANVSPSFSPDGKRLLFGEPDGIHIANIGTGNDCSAISRAPLVIRGGTQGFWSAAGR